MKISYDREQDILMYEVSDEFMAATTKIAMKSMNETLVEASA